MKNPLAAEVNVPKNLVKMAKKDVNGLKIECWVVTVDAGDDMINGSSVVSWAKKIKYLIKALLC